MMQRSNESTQAVFIYEENSADSCLKQLFPLTAFLEKYTYHWLKIRPFLIFREQGMFEQLTWFLQLVVLFIFLHFLITFAMCCLT